MKNPLGYITDEVTNIRVVKHFNVFTDLENIKQNLKNPTGITNLLHGITYSAYPEKLFLTLNNSKFNVGINDRGYYTVKIPTDEPWVFIKTPDGVFHAKLKESRWDL